MLTGAGDGTGLGFFAPAPEGAGGDTGLGFFALKLSFHGSLIASAEIVRSRLRLLSISGNTYFTVAIVFVIVRCTSATCSLV